MTAVTHIEPPLPLAPVRSAWPEYLGRELVAARAGGRCEGCATAGPLEWHHRVRRSHGGTWAPSNGLHLCNLCHGWAHAHPTLAVRAGFLVHAGTAPGDAPAWLRTVLSVDGAAWWRLDDEATYVHAPDDHDPRAPLVGKWMTWQPPRRTGKSHR